MGHEFLPGAPNQGFTHAFVRRFGSDADRDAYLVHPDHVAFGRLPGPIRADGCVIDDWTQRWRAPARQNFQL